MPTIKIKIDADTYEIDTYKLTLGEKWLMESEYGVKPGSDVGFGALAGYILIGMRRRDPQLTVNAAKAQVEALTDERIEVTADEPDPTPAAGSGKPGGSGRSRKAPGSPT